MFKSLPLIKGFQKLFFLKLLRSRNWNEDKSGDSPRYKLGNARIKEIQKAKNILAKKMEAFCEKSVQGHEHPPEHFFPQSVSKKSSPFSRK